MTQLKTLGLRKIMLGMVFMVGMFGLTGQTVFMVPGESLGGALGGLATVCTGISLGLGAVIYGNVKEHQAKGK